MKKKLFAGLATGLLMVSLVGLAEATIIDGTFSGTISDSLTRGSAIIPGAIVDGDPFTLNFSYNADIATPVITQSGLILYGISSPNDSWISLNVGGNLWESLGSISISVYNDYSGNPNHSIDQFRMGFRAADGTSFPGFLSQGGVEWAITAAYAPGTSPSLVESLALPLSMTDLSMSEVNDTYSSINSRSGDDIWLYRLNIDLSTFELHSSMVPVPEPTTILLLATGIVGLAGTRLRRKKG